MGFSKQPIERFLEDAWSNSRDDILNSITTVYSPRYGFWGMLARKKARALDTVDLPDCMKTKFIEDIGRYLSTKTREEYHHRGIPYRSGYLLHGPPGTGKTSLCMAIATHFRLKVCGVSGQSGNHRQQFGQAFMTFAETWAFVARRCGQCGSRPRTES